MKNGGRNQREVHRHTPGPDAHLLERVHRRARLDLADRLPNPQQTLRLLLHLALLPKQHSRVVEVRARQLRVCALEHHQPQPVQAPPLVLPRAQVVERLRRVREVVDGGGEVVRVRGELAEVVQRLGVRVGAAEDEERARGEGEVELGDLGLARAGGDEAGGVERASFLLGLGGGAEEGDGLGGMDGQVSARGQVLYGCEVVGEVAHRFEVVYGFEGGGALEEGAELAVGHRKRAVARGPAQLEDRDSLRSTRSALEGVALLDGN